MLEADPDLAEGLGAEEAGRAKRASEAETLFLAPGPWSSPVGAEGGQATLGLLVLGGLLTREVRLAGRCSVELLGQGDLLRPWQPDVAEDAVVPSESAWAAVEPTLLTVLDRSFQRRVNPWPEVTAALTGRAAQRARSLAVRLAIAQMPRLDQRLLLILWHLADRWGRVAPDGRIVPLQLSHRLLAELVSAQRPSVTVALRGLTERRLVSRRSDGYWVLPGDPPSDLSKIATA